MPKGSGGASPEIRKTVRSRCTAQIKDGDDAHPLDTFISFFKTNAGDLADASNHTSYPKKSFLRLFIFTDEDYPVYISHSLVFTPGRPPLLPGATPAGYYVYALREILV